MSEIKRLDMDSELLIRQKAFAQKAKNLLAERYDHPPLAYVHTFGCQQNVSDGEKISGMLSEIGYGPADSPETADLVIYNTCAVRENAEDRVFGNVGALKPVKQKRQGMLIGLCGCMMQQQSAAEKIKQSIIFSLISIIRRKAWSI